MDLRVLGLVLVAVFSLQAQPRADAGKFFEEARHAFEQRQWDRARAAAEKALAADPQMGDAEVLLGLVATAQGHAAEAREHFERGVMLQPENYRAHAYLGSAYLQQGRLGEASGAFHRTLELHPGDLTATYSLGVIALAQRKAADALRYFETVTRANTSDVTAWLGVLESQLILGRNAEAQQSIGRVQRLVADDDPRLVQMAALLTEHNDFADASEVLERAWRASPHSYELAYNLTLACMQTRRYDRAAEVMGRFTGLEGKAEAFDLLGTIEEKRGRATEAERAFGEAARREPANEEYRFDYGNALLQHGKTAAALTVFGEGAEELPKSWRLRIGLGSAYYLAGDYERSAGALLDAVRLKPDSIPAYYLLGEAYESAPKRQAEIVQAFDQYLRTSPRNAQAYYHYGAILYARGNPQGAEASLKEALRLDPKLAEAHLQLGILALADGRTPEGVGMLERAAQLAPRLAAAHYRLGLVYQRMGDATRAKKEMEEFRALQAEGRERERVLSSLSSVAR